MEKEPIAEKEPIIEFKGVTKRFAERTILNKVDFKIYEGEVTTLIGLSGTGKSVTLKHIIGLLKPDEGQVLYRGKPIDQMSKKEWNAYIGSISYMFQNNALFDSMTIVENVALPLRQTTHMGKKEITEKEGRTMKKEILGYADNVKGWIGEKVDQRVGELLELMKASA